MSLSLKSAGSKLSPDNPWFVVGIMLVGAFMALLDVTIVNVALPDIERGIGASNSTLVWIISVYALAFGLMLIPAGRIGDNYGHKLVFVTGLAIFTIGSLASGLSHDSFQIIVARTIQGIGAGIFIPSIRAAIRILFEGRERSRAFSALGATIGASTALGPLLGGILVQYFGWPFVFYVNIPIGIIIVPVAIKLLPRLRHHDQKHGLDPVGIALLAVALVLILFPLVQGQASDWPYWIWIMFGGSALAFFLLWLWESRQQRRGLEPVVPPDLFHNRHFTAGTFLSIFYFASFTSIFFIVSVLWQDGLHKSALLTGLTILPFALASMISSSQSHKFSHLFGRNVLFIGCGMMAIGLIGYLAALLIAGTSINLWLLMLPFIVAGAGNGLVIAPVQDFVIASVEKRRVGTASGIFSTAQRIGSAMGIAVVGSIFFTVIRHSHSGSAASFVDATIVAAYVNVALVIVALALVFTLPKTAE